MSGVSKINLDCNRETLIDKALETLEKAIISGEILPEERLSEAKLAKQMGISRAPVREALIRLEEAKIIKKTHRGREVVKISIDELKELYDIKMLLEGHAASRGCKFENLKFINKLKILIDKMDKLIKPEDYLNLRKTNYQFHDLLVKSGENQNLYNTYLSVVKQIRWTTHLSLGKPGQPVQSNKEHREIFEAFKNGDGRRVRRLIEKHGENTVSRIFTT
jgi:DNA-binding GntR family transcriptional regulator